MSSSNMPLITSGVIDGRAKPGAIVWLRYRLDPDRFLTGAARTAIVGLG